MAAPALSGQILKGDTMRNTLAAAAAALAIALPAAASAGAAGQLPSGWEIVSTDGEKVFRNTISGIALTTKIIPADGELLGDVANEVARQKECTVEKSGTSYELACKNRLTIILEPHDKKSIGMLIISCGTAPDRVCQKDGTDFIKFLSRLGKQASAKD